MRSRSPSPSRSTARPAGNSAPKRAARATRSTARRRSPKSICSPIRIIPGASRFRCCGTKSAAPSSTTNRPKSSACSIPRSMLSPMCAPIITPRNCARKSIASTTSSIRTSTTASIAPALPRARAAYEEAARAIFATFDQLEERLSRQRYLAGRADHRSGLAAVHHAHSLRHRLLQPFQMQSAARRRLSQSVELFARSISVPGIAETVSIDHIKRHYYGSQRQVNPTGIVPIGPLIDFTAPHDRDRFS